MKNILILLSIFTISIARGQQFPFKLDGAKEVKRKFLIIEYNNGTHQSNQIESFKIEKITLNQELKDISSIKLQLGLDTITLKERPPELAVFGLDLEGIDKLATDSLVVRMDSFPFRYERTREIIATESLDKLMDFQKMSLILINKDSHIIQFPEFDDEKQSDYYSVAIREEVCECMGQKEFDKSSFKETMESCLAKPMERIIPLLDFTLKNYSYDSKKDFETFAIDFIQKILSKVNLYYNENCYMK